MLKVLSIIGYLGMAAGVIAQFATGVAMEFSHGVDAALPHYQLALAANPRNTGLAIRNAKGVQFNNSRVLAADGAAFSAENSQVEGLVPAKKGE